MPRLSFDDLPLRKGGPPFSAWELYGPDDELGSLNLLTAETTQAAATEIKIGIRICLDLPINFSLRPSHARLPLTHEVLRKDPRLVHDDEIHLNTQIFTQWDKFRHYGYQKERIVYNSVRIDDISGPGRSDRKDTEAWYRGPSITNKLGIQEWCKGGIVDRGVLLEYLAWAENNGISYDLLRGHAITVDELKAWAKVQQVELKEGDILLVRSGWKIG